MLIVVDEKVSGIELATVEIVANFSIAPLKLCERYNHKIKT